MLKQKIGFIGLDHMGKPMPIRLRTAGYDVTVFDMSEAVVQSFVNQCSACDCSSWEVADEVETVITSLLTPPIVREAALGAEGNAGAINGTLAIMVSCPNDVFQAYKSKA